MTAQLRRIADVSRRTYALTGRHLMLMPSPRTVEEIEAGLPPRTVTLAEEILDDAAIAAESAHKAYMTRLAYRSAQARAARKTSTNP